MDLTEKKREEINEKLNSMDNMNYGESRLIFDEFKNVMRTLLTDVEVLKKRIKILELDKETK